MDGRRFDGLARLVAHGGSRRATLGLLGAGVLDRLGSGAALADDKDANCRGSCDACDRDGQCCSRRCEGGACTCRERGRCAHDRACCSGRCRDGRCQRAADPNPGCGGGGGMCAGVPFEPGNFTQCGTTDSVNYPCFCAQDACVADTFADSVEPCPTGDCPGGQTCVPGLGPNAAGGCLRPCPNPYPSG